MIVVIFQTEVTFDEKAGNKSSYGHKKSKLKNPLLRSRSPKHEGGGGGGFVSNGVIGGKAKIIDFNNCWHKYDRSPGPWSAVVRSGFVCYKGPPFEDPFFTAAYM